MDEQFSRTAMLLGEAGMERLRKARVAVFGLGGVGGYVVEALCRAGVGALDLIDKDTVSLSNLNRQILATHATVGMLKTHAAALRTAEINPACIVREFPMFYLPETAGELPLENYSYIVDAVDTVTAKLALAQRATALGVPIISCMGTGNKLDPSALRVADISETSVCPLARVMRRELKRRGIFHLKVVYSPEPPLTPTGWEAEAAALGKRQIPGSVSFVPSAAGLLLAGQVVRDIAGV